jgi:hypothetical protein
MRIPPVPAQAAAALLDVRTPRRQSPAGAPQAATGTTPAHGRQDASPAAATPDLAPRLPVAIADRLAHLLAQDPGLAEAVTAQLPAARRDSARDLAGYGATEPGRHLDLAG